MQVDTKKEKICINQIVEKKKEDIIVEGDVIVPDIKPDILNTIYSSGTICIYKKELLEGKIRIDGAVNLNIIYLADANENVRSLSAVLDFSKIINMEKSNSEMYLENKMAIKDVECKVLNGRKINIKVNIDADFTTYLNEDVEFIKEVEGINDLKLLDKKVMINSLKANNQTKIFAKDTITIDSNDNLAEIMKSQVKITNKDMKISYNKVLAKSEVNVDIMYLTEDNRIRNVVGTIPAVGFIDVEGISEENICNTNYEIKNLVIKPNSVQEHSIFVEVEIEVICKVYESKEMNIIQDLYSPLCDLKINNSSLDVSCMKENMTNSFSMKEKQQIPEIDPNKLFQVDAKPVITSKKVLRDKIIFEGEINVNYMFESKVTNTLATQSLIIPFTNEVKKEGVATNAKIDATVEILNQNFDVNNDMIELNFELEFGINIFEGRTINVINSVEIDENRAERKSSIVIYFVRNGDTLWSIAKKFKSTVEDIVATNQIEEGKTINPGMKLFIR